MGREPIFAMAGPSEAVGDSVGILASNENTCQCTVFGQAREGSMQQRCAASSERHSKSMERMRKGCEAGKRERARGHCT